jgi:hypothetical protein
VGSNSVLSECSSVSRPTSTCKLDDSRLSQGGIRSREPSVSHPGCKLFSGERLLANVCHYSRCAETVARMSKNLRRCFDLHFQSTPITYHGVIVLQATWPGIARRNIANEVVASLAWSPKLKRPTFVRVKWFDHAKSVGITTAIDAWRSSVGNHVSHHHANV